MQALLEVKVVMKKYHVAWVPACICPCTKIPDRPNALSLGFNQAKEIEADTKDGLELPQGTGFRSIKCCNCGKDTKYSLMFVFQKIDRYGAAALNTVRDDFLNPRGWVLAGTVEAHTTSSYGLN